MINAKTLQSEKTPSQSPEPEGQEGHQDVNALDQEDFDQDFSEEDDDEEEDYNIVLYHIPTKKPDPKQAKIQAEKLKQRSQQIQQRKQEAKNKDSLITLTIQEPETNFFSLKKIADLSRPKIQIHITCYISEKNLLLVLLPDCFTIQIYHTISFKLITVKKSKSPVTCLSYSKHLRMILVGGRNSLLQLWSAKTFEIEGESLQKGYQSFHTVTYIPKSNVIIAKSWDSIWVCNTGLKHLFMVYLPSYYADASGKANFQAITKELLVMSTNYNFRQRLYLINLKAKTLEEKCTQHFIPCSTCVVLTEKSPTNIFTCLMAYETNPSESFSEWHPFTLTQFTIHSKTGEFAISRKTPTSHTFSKLYRPENSPYFIAQKSSQETWMLTIERNQVNIIRVISRPLPIILDKYHTFIMLKNGSSIIEVNNNENKIFGYRWGHVTQKSKDESHKSLDKSDICVFCRLCVEIF